MQKIIMEAPKNETISIEDVSEYAAVFAKREGKFCGMIVKEEKNGGFILRLGGTSGATGHHETLRKCIESCKCHGYEFFT